MSCPPEQHQHEDGQGEYQDKDARAATALFTGCFVERGEGAGHEADEEADELGGVLSECFFYHNREEDDPDGRADAHREEVEHVFRKLARILARKRINGS